MDKSEWKAKNRWAEVEATVRQSRQLIEETRQLLTDAKALLVQLEENRARISKQLLLKKEVPF